MTVLAASVAAAVATTTSCQPESTIRTARSASGGLSVPGVGFTHVANPAQPTDDTGAGGGGGTEPVDRRAPIAVRGWQLYLVLTGLLAAAARTLQSAPPEDR